MKSMGSRSNRETAGLATARLKFPGNARRSIASEDLRASAETDVGHPGHARPQGRLRSQRRLLENVCGRLPDSKPPVLVRRYLCHPGYSGGSSSVSSEEIVQKFDGELALYCYVIHGGEIHLGDAV